MMYGSTMFDTKSLNDKEDMYCVEHEHIEIWLTRRICYTFTGCVAYPHCNQLDTVLT